MGRTEEITSEVRRLVLTCRSLEAQVKESIPKKQHEAIVAKLETTINELNAELKRTQANLENTTTLGERLVSLESLVSKQSDSISSAQSEEFQKLSMKISENTVPSTIYEQTLSSVKELELTLSTIVQSKDAQLATLSARTKELEDKISSMVSRSEFLGLQSELSKVRSKHQEELNQIAQRSVPKEQYESTRARISELETMLSNSIPLSQLGDIPEQMKSVLATIEGDATPCSSIPNEN